MSINYEKLEESKNLLNTAKDTTSENLFPLLTVETISCGDISIENFKNTYELENFVNDSKNYIDLVDNAEQKIKEAESAVKGESIS